MKALASTLLVHEPSSAYSSATRLPVHGTRMAVGARSSAPQMATVATVKTSLGDLKFELFTEQMPITTSNFIDLAKSGFYDGLHIHRIVKGFVVQFGCPLTRDTTSMLAGGQAGQGGPPPGSTFTTPDGQTITRDSEGRIPDEFVGDITNAKNTLAMANKDNQPNSGGSQMFINLIDNPDLDYWNDNSESKHPVFGQLSPASKMTFRAIANSLIHTESIPGKQESSGLENSPKTPIEITGIDITEEEVTRRRR